MTCRVHLVTAKPAITCLFEPVATFLEKSLRFATLFDSVRSMGRGAAGFGSPNSIESLGSSVYTRSRGSSVGHSPTKTSRLRSNIIKISCYLNGEADRSRCTVVRLPEECDTLGEILPKIHARMGMDKRICFASSSSSPTAPRSNLPLPHRRRPARPRDHRRLRRRFDPTTVPYDLLEAARAAARRR